MAHPRTEEDEMNPTLARLNAEWDRIATSPAATAALARWAAREPALSPYADPAAAIAPGPGRRGTDRAALAALARLAPGDDFAARAVLQAVLPGLMRLAASRCADDPVSFEELVSFAWERIRTYPCTRGGSVAANVILDVRKRYRRHRRIEAPRSAEVCEESLDLARSAEDLAMARSGLDDVVAAQRSGLIDEVALHLVLRTRGDDVPLATAAAERHTTAAHANCLRWRAERRLRPHLAAAR
ncbi:MAG: hypothetical protein ACLGIO_06190 [Acidimicrobiia bacterium]